MPVVNYLRRSLAAQFALARAEPVLNRVPRVAVAIAHLLENFRIVALEVVIAGGVVVRHYTGD
jgi:hypothetical protein